MGVLGEGTARPLREAGIIVDFCPESKDPEEAVREFAKRIHPKEKIIAACSTISLNRLADVLPKDILISWPFYETKPLESIAKTEAQYLIFTSPSNASAYLDHHSLDSYQTAVAIGKSSFKALKDRGYTNIIQSKKPQEEWIWVGIIKSFETLS